LGLLELLDLLVVGVLAAAFAVLPEGKSSLAVALLLELFVGFVVLGDVTECAALAALQSGWLARSFFSFCHDGQVVYSLSRLNSRFRGTFRRTTIERGITFLSNQLACDCQ